MEYNNCNNCGKKGHIFSQCKMPIISIGIIAVRKNPTTNEAEYCMICRRNTLGFMDFIRGKYSVYNQYHITNMIKQMTKIEKKMLKTMEFDDIWNIVWGNTKRLCSQYKNEEQISREKFNQLRKGVLFGPNVQIPHPPPGLKHPDDNFYQYNSGVNKIIGYNLNLLIDNCGTYWEDAEWGFPKGRRNFNESDLDCGLREFCEETGFVYLKEYCNVVNNIFPFEETFIGSNYKSYKHKYFLMFVDYEHSERGFNVVSPNYEVSIIKWKNIDDCLSSIRPYNLEKKNMISGVNQLLSRYIFR
jgi:8-oxo-dGTP pyrophosphatase MutT (NUDIX family)